MTRVLVVDDDPQLRSALTRALRLESYTVEEAADGVAAYRAIQDDPPDAVVLDVMMPEMDGLALCKQIRRDGHDLPVIVLTARHLVSDRVNGLDAGADDYVVKPFALEELLARLRALLRRTSPASAGEVLRVGDLELDPASREARRGDREIALTRTEYALLELLMQHPGQVLTREVIFERVWGCDLSGSSNSLDVYVGYLRRKTEEGGAARLIRTVRGVGYVLKEP